MSPKTTITQSSVLMVACGTAMLITLVLFTFWGVHTFEYLNIDDNEYVTENVYVASGLKWENVRWAFLNAHSGHWHPLTWISLMSDVEIFGLNPGAAHVVNLSFHCFAIILLYWLLLRLGTTNVCAFIVAAFIGISPLRLESVAWITERKDVLSIFFGLLTLHCYLSYVQKRRFFSYVLMLLAYGLGLMSKPSLVPLPILMLLLDFWPLKRLASLPGSPTNYTKILVEKIPLVVVALLVSMLTLNAQSLGGGLKPLSAYPISQRFVLSSVGYLTYLGKLFWPFNLAVFYPIREVPSGLAAGSFFSLILFTYFAFKQRHSRPYLVFGWLWFLISALPIIGVVQVGAQQVADRWTYLPHIGLVWAGVSFLAEEAQTRRLKKFGIGVAALVLIALVYQTRQHLFDWSTSERLFQQALEVAPDNFFAHTNLGVELDRQQKLEAAAFHYQEALRFNPTYSIAINNLGSIRARQGNLKQSIELFEQALASSPDFLPARYHLGLAQEMQGNHFVAIYQWLRVLTLDPGFERAFNSLQFVADKLGELSCEDLRVQMTATDSMTLSLIPDVLNAVQKTPALSPLLARISSMRGCF